MWLGEMIIGQDNWEICVRLGIFSSQEEARFVAEEGSSEPRLSNYLGRPAIKILINSRYHHFYDSDMVIRELSEEKQAQMGPPIDPREEEGPQRILETLKTMDPKYVVHDSDMVPSSMTLADLLDRHGEGCRLDNIAWGVQEHNQDTCRHVLGTIGDYRIVDLESPEIIRHIRQIQEFNTTRRAVIHPGYLELCRFCINCGAQNDIEANSRRYKEIMDNLGGY